MADQRRQLLRKIKIRAQLQMFQIPRTIQMALRLSIRQTQIQIQTPHQRQAMAT